MAHSEASPETWDRYWSGDPAARDEILTAYLPMAQAVARTTWAKLRHHVEFDELFQDASIGLIQALERFEQGHDIKFSTFAMHRIHGAIFDAVRKRDWLPRKLRAEQKALLAATERLEDRGHLPSPQELSEETGLSVKRIEEIEYRLWLSTPDSTDRVCGEDGMTVGDLIVDEVFVDDYELTEWRLTLLEEMRYLTSRQRLILMLTSEGLTVKEIAKREGVNYTKMIAAHHQGLDIMRRRLSLSPCDADPIKDLENGIQMLVPIVVTNMQPASVRARKKRRDNRGRHHRSKPRKSATERRSRVSYEPPCSCGKCKRCIGAKGGRPSLCGRCGKCERCYRAAYARAYAERRRREAQTN